MATGESKKLSMKLLINLETNRVLFAEAGKDCVDFLFHILTLPVSAIGRLLRQQEGMVGSLGKLYESIENLDDTYIQHGRSKDTILKMKTPIPTYASLIPLMLLDHSNDDDNGNDHDDEAYDDEEEEEDEEPITASRMYRCSNYENCPYPVYSDDPNAECHCHRKMTSWMDYVAPPGAEVQVARSADSESDGFVKGVTYMVMDDLEVKPMSTILSLTLLNKFNVKQVDVLQEKVVQVGMKEAVKLLKTSLISNMVLTEVFLSNNCTDSKLAWTNN